MLAFKSFTVTVTVTSAFVESERDGQGEMKGTSEDGKREGEKERGTEQEETAKRRQG